MAQTIKMRRSATASAVPTTGQLALGEIAINTYDGKVYIKKDNGTQSIVEVTGGAGGASVTTSTTAPSSPAAGDLWWDSTYGKLKIYYTDANTSQWVDAFIGVKGDTGDTGPAGADGASGTINASTATTYTGVLKGNGTNVVTATAGTDYLAPPSGTALLKANSGGALANATAGTDYLAPPTGTALLKANSGGALANATAGTDYFAPDANGNLGVNFTPDNTAWVQIGGGTTAKCALEFESGTLMTTPDAGSMEYDGTLLYFTPGLASARGVVPADQLLLLGSTNTLTSQTAAQPLFDNVTANGRVSVPVGTYQFECFYSLSAMSGNNSFGFALVAGTAVIASQQWMAQANKAALATPTAATMTYNTAASTALTASNTTATGYAFIKGYVRISTAGTIIPSVSLGGAAAAVVGVGSYFKISAVSPVSAAATNISIGNWS